MPRKKPKSRRPAGRKTATRRKHFFEYPLVIFMLLCSGIFLAAWTFRAAADDVFVSARVSGPLVTLPAQITSPAAGIHFSGVPITVQGTCPPNAAYVEIFRNNRMSGSAICSASNTFSLSSDLLPGRNDLTAHSFNITDDEGPVSVVVTVFYDQPPVTQPSKGGAPAGSSSSGQQNPLLLKTAFLYKGFYVGEKIDWPLSLSGGSAPYAVDVDWGDGSNDVLTRTKAGDFNINHTYSSQGGYKSSYTIKVKASDASNQTAYIQFFVIVNSQQNAGIGGNIFSKPPPRIGGGISWLWLAWPAYVLVLAMGASYWLGEREELIILRRKGLLKR